MKQCHCDISSALYIYMGDVKCQYCDGKVVGEREEEYILYNTPVEE